MSIIFLEHDGSGFVPSQQAEPLPCLLCGKPADARWDGPAGCLLVCYACGLDSLVALLADAMIGAATRIRAGDRARMLRRTVCGVSSQQVAPGIEARFCRAWAKAMQAAHEQAEAEALAAAEGG